MGADQEDDDDALTWVDYLGDQLGPTAFAFFRESARTQERPRRHCISPRSALGRKHARLYVRSRNERHKHTHSRTHPRTHTYAHLTRHSEVRWKPRTLFSESIESLHRPASGHLRSATATYMRVLRAVFALRNNAASQPSSWTVTASRHPSRAPPIGHGGRSSTGRTPKYGTDRRRSLMPPRWTYTPLFVLLPLLLLTFISSSFVFVVFFLAVSLFPSLFFSLSNYCPFLYLSLTLPSRLVPRFSHPVLLFFDHALSASHPGKKYTTT